MNHLLFQWRAKASSSKNGVKKEVVVKVAKVYLMGISLSRRINFSAAERSWRYNLPSSLKQNIYPPQVNEKVVNKKLAGKLLSVRNKPSFICCTRTTLYRPVLVNKYWSRVGAAGSDNAFGPNRKYINVWLSWCAYEKQGRQFDWKRKLSWNFRGILNETVMIYA